MGLFPKMFLARPVCLWLVQWKGNVAEQIAHVLLIERNSLP